MGAKLRGRLYEITNLGSFIESYLKNCDQPEPESVRALKGVRVSLRPAKQAPSDVKSSVESETNESGAFELETSDLPDVPVFVLATGGDGAALASHASQPITGPCYRSAPFRISSIDEQARNIYVAVQPLPSESGFSQTDLASILQHTKEKTSDIESMTGVITDAGIRLSGKGKGATAEARVLLWPEWSPVLDSIVSHTMEDFRLDLPGPAWLVGLLVSKEAIEESVRAGVRDLAAEINLRLKKRAVERLWSSAALGGNHAEASLESQASLSLGHIRYPVESARGGANSDEVLAITGDAYLGFPRVLFG